MQLVLASRLRACTGIVRYTSGILGIMALGRSVPQLKVNNMSDYFRATFQIPQADLTITNSADILRYLYGCHAGRSSTK